MDAIDGSDHGDGEQVLGGAKVFEVLFGLVLELQIGGEETGGLGVLIFHSFDELVDAVLLMADLFFEKRVQHHGTGAPLFDPLQGIEFVGQR